MFEYISTFDFTYEIVQTKTKNLRYTWILNLEEQFYQHFPSRNKYGTTYTYVIHAQKGEQNHPILSDYPSRLKKSPNKGWIKIVPHRTVFYPVLLLI